MFPAASTSLKRTHSESPPDLPRLSNPDLILLVFTHKSLGRDDLYDSEKLNVLGDKAFHLAVTSVLFKHRPMLSAMDIETERKNIFANENYEKWVAAYNLRSKIRCHPDSIPSLMTIEATKAILHTYLGAIFQESGLDVLQNWASRLVYPDSNSHPAEPTGPAPPIPSTPPPPKKLKNEPISPPYFPFVSPHSGLYQNFAQPPRQAPPHMPAGPNPLAPAQPGLAFLPLFNQTANQRRVAVEYPAVFNGPQHAGQWTVQCVVNGIRKGQGTGNSKQIAKEEAARQAYFAMGWT